MPEESSWSPAGFRSLDGLRADLDAIEASERAGTLRATGNWSPGQVLEHCGRFMRFSFDGFPGKPAPGPVRWVAGALLKPRLMRGQMKPGFKLPRSASALLPPDGVSFDEGMGVMRSQLAREAAGERMERPSPLLGRMTHDDWVALHLNHCRMHFGFLRRG